MLLQLAWKNIWRNKKRSIIILLAIILGLWAGLFSGSIMMGMAESMVNSAIDRYLGHIQIHTPAYQEDKQVGYTLKDVHSIERVLKKNTHIKAYTERTILEGMAASPTTSFGVQIVGINRVEEKSVTGLHSRIIEGNYLGSKQKNQILIGQKLAKRLNLRLRSKVVLTFQNKQGEIIYLACKITGIFKTESGPFDETTVFLKRIDILRATGSQTPLIHEIAIRTYKEDQVEKTAQELADLLPQLKVETWKKLAPELAFVSSSMEAFTYLFVAIILFALLFGITNNMLMSVMERIKELGVLTAVGMNRIRIFTLILFESVMLSLTGGLIGMVLSISIIQFFNKSGIDLSLFASGLEKFGSSSMLFPYLPVSMYAVLTVMIIIAANIAALLPAWKATHLLPADAIRSY